MEMRDGGDSQLCLHSRSLVRIDMCFAIMLVRVKVAVDYAALKQKKW